MPAGTEERGGVDVGAGGDFGGGLRTVDVECVGDVSVGVSTKRGKEVVKVRVVMLWEEFRTRVMRRRWCVMDIVGRC